MPTKPQKPKKQRTHDQIYIDDAKQFVALYEFLTIGRRGSPPLGPGERKTLRQAIEKGCKRRVLEDGYATILSRIVRIYDFFWPGRPQWRGSGANELFHEVVPGSGVQPSPQADAVYRNLKNWIVSFEQLKPGVKSDLKAKKKPIRIGCPHSIGLRMISAALSQWRTAFQNELELELTIENSIDLLRQLNASLVDAVFTYGPTEHCEIKSEGEYAITFDPLYKRVGGGFADDPSFVSQSVLICHPEQDLVMKDGSNPNKDYWEEEYRDRAKDSEFPTLSQLKEIDLNKIVVEAINLVRVSAWHEPEGVRDFLESIKRDVKTVHWHEEALAYTRSGLTVALVSESTALRRGITAFRIEPVAKFARSIGVCTRLGDPVQDETKLLIHFMELFVTSFGSQIRKIKAPRYGDPQMDEFLEEFKKYYFEPFLQERSKGKKT